MISGNVKTATRVLGFLAVTGLALVPAVGMAQTPDEACAADSLYLISPEAILMQQQVTGRPGLTISWADISTSESTCYTLTGADDLGYTVDVDGGFGDQVDRQIAFDASANGVVGQQVAGVLHLNWQTQGAATYGVLAGSINIANNGGVLRWDSVDGDWSHVNSGLPMTWFQTNITTLAQGSGGFLLASITSGATIDTNPRGLWVYRSGVWSRIGEDTFAASTIFTAVAVSPTNNDVFAVGTSRAGLFVTTDGGENFTQYTTQLDPGFENMPSTFRVEALNWDSSRLFVFLPNYGLFISENGGSSFSRSEIMVEENLDSPTPDLIMPTAINDIAIDPGNEDRILLGLNFNGTWESTDGGQTWNDLYGDLNVPGGDPGVEDDGQWIYSVKSLAIDSVDSQVIVVGINQRGIYRTGDGGNTWVLVAEDLQPESLATLTSFSVKANPGTGGQFFVQEDDHALLVSSDGGLNWAEAPAQPFVPTGRKILFASDGSGDLLYASYKGGIYEPGAPLNLSDTYNSSTSSYLRNLELGLELTLSEGPVLVDDNFTLVCQTFQGWAVWRSPSHDRYNMTLLGLYDRVNPESCIEGYCGDESYDLVPQCYVSKRAACFNFDTPDTIRFFDDEVYNGFSYYYAIGTFDYGNTALTSPQNNTNSMVFSPRFPADDNSPFIGNGNSSFIQINSGTADPVRGETIYVYPNPLRRDAGLPGSEGEEVVFTNLPSESRIRVFTTAGDDIINLGPENMQAGNIYWDTRNYDGEAVAPGVYLYKAESPAREAHWGKLIIIR